eukprot:90615-Prorocentrum_minimum.AAC.4
MSPCEEGTPQPKRHKLVGHANFKRHNPMSDRFTVHSFHHLDFWCVANPCNPPSDCLTPATVIPDSCGRLGVFRCADASNTYRRFAHGLGMQLVAKSDQSTGNHTFASYVVRFVLPHQRLPVIWVNQLPLDNMMCIMRVKQRHVRFHCAVLIQGGQNGRFCAPAIRSGVFPITHDMIPLSCKP